MEIIISSILKLGISLWFSYELIKLLLNNKVEWITSIRSLVTLLIATTFCYMAYASKVPAKDFLLIVSTIMNFYFLVKQRLLKNGEKGENHE